MTNKEKYRDEIENHVFSGLNFAVDSKGNIYRCSLLNNCNDCIFDKHKCYSDKLDWLKKEYVEPKKSRYSEEIRNLKVDDKVLVSNDGKGWLRRYFAMYDDEKDLVYCTSDGATSWSLSYLDCWEYAKLPEE